MVTSFPEYRDKPFSLIISHAQLYSLRKFSPMYSKTCHILFMPTYNGYAYVFDLGI